MWYGSGSMTTARIYRPTSLAVKTICLFLDLMAINMILVVSIRKLKLIRIELIRNRIRI